VAWNRNCLTIVLVQTTLWGLYHLSLIPCTLRLCNSVLILRIFLLTKMKHHEKGKKLLPPLCSPYASMFHVPSPTTNPSGWLKLLLMNMFRTAIHRHTFTCKKHAAGKLKYLYSQHWTNWVTSATMLGTHGYMQQQISQKYITFQPNCSWMKSSQVRRRETTIAFCCQWVMTKWL
jgi:hypothetical protein